MTPREDGSWICASFHALRRQSGELSRGQRDGCLLAAHQAAACRPWQLGWAFMLKGLCWTVLAPARTGKLKFEKRSRATDLDAARNVARRRAWAPAESEKQTNKAGVQRGGASASPSSEKNRNKYSSIIFVTFFSSRPIQAESTPAVARHCHSRATRGDKSVGRTKSLH